MFVDQGKILFNLMEIDLEKSWAFQNLSSFHESVLEKNTLEIIGPSRTAAKRSITHEASEKLKKCFLEKTIENIGLELWQKSEGLKTYV
jgi:hypothetical protein